MNTFSPSFIVYSFCRWSERERDRETDKNREREREIACIETQIYCVVGIVLGSGKIVIVNNLNSSLPSGGF